MTAEPIVAIALTGRAALALATADAAGLAALDAAHERRAADVIVLGTDTWDGSRATRPVARAVDPVSVAVARHGRYPRWGFLAASCVTRDHPYNLARRILGAHHLTGARVGLLLADDDPGLPLDDGRLPWLPRHPPGPEVTADAAAAVRALWHSWPAGTIVGDRVSGQYARVDGVHPIDHDGAYRIRGPLPTPASDDGDPVLAAWLTSAGWAELTISPTAVELPAETGSVHVVSDIDALDDLPARTTDAAGPTLRNILRLPAHAATEKSDRATEAPDRAAEAMVHG